MFKEGIIHNPVVIPEFDRGKLNDLLSGRYFQNLFNSIIARTRISGFEQALTVLAKARTGQLSVGQSREIDQRSVNNRFTEYIDNGLRPLIAIHTHAAESWLDLNGRQKYYEGTSFLPSPSDIDTSHVFDINGVQFINLTEAMIVTSSTPRLWIWQTPNKNIQINASKTADNYFNTITRDITESDINEFKEELLHDGLYVSIGRLDSKNPAKSFAEIYSALDMHAGYVY